MSSGRCPQNTPCLHRVRFETSLRSLWAGCVCRTVGEIVVKEAKTTEVGQLSKKVLSSRTHCMWVVSDGRETFCAQERRSSYQRSQGRRFNRRLYAVLLLLLKYLPIYVTLFHLYHEHGARFLRLTLFLLPPLRRQPSMSPPTHRNSLQVSDPVSPSGLEYALSETWLGYRCRGDFRGCYRRCSRSVRGGNLLGSICLGGFAVKTDFFNGVFSAAIEFLAVESCPSAVLTESVGHFTTTGFMDGHPGRFEGSMGTNLWCVYDRRDRFAGENEEQDKGDTIIGCIRAGIAIMGT